MADDQPSRRSAGWSTLQSDPAETQLNALAQRQATQLAFLTDVSVALAAAKDRNQILNIIGERLSAALPVAGGLILLRDQLSTGFQIAHIFGSLLTNPRLGTGINAGVGLLASVLEDGQARDASAAERERLSPWERQFVAREQSLLWVALASPQHVEGAIGLVSHNGNRFRPDEGQLAMAVAASVALVLLKDQLPSSIAQNDDLQQARSEAQAAKLAAMGRLTASIAHELRNPLQGLQTSLQLLVNQALGEEKQELVLRMAQHEVERLIVTLQRMLDCYRPSREGMRPLSIHELLESALTIAGPQLEELGIEAERQWGENLPRIRGVGHHLRQVFLSLILNAAEAMTEEGGRLLVRTSLRQDGVDTPQVLIEVTDSGPGIPSEALDMIFEPFYTTRTNHIGLGLAISYSIIEQHDGALSVSSSGRGTTFVVRLPAL